jgi:hypothetical protein
MRRAAWCNAADALISREVRKNRRSLGVNTRMYGASEARLKAILCGQCVYSLVSQDAGDSGDANYNRDDAIDICIARALVLTLLGLHNGRKVVL